MDKTEKELASLSDAELMRRWEETGQPSARYKNGNMRQRDVKILDAILNELRTRKTTR